MKIIIDGEPKEIADLLLAVEDRQDSTSEVLTMEKLVKKLEEYAVNPLTRCLEDSRIVTNKEDVDRLARKLNEKLQSGQ